MSFEKRVVGHGAYLTANKRNTETHKLPIKGQRPKTLIAWGAPPGIRYANKNGAITVRIILTALPCTGLGYYPLRIAPSELIYSMVLGRPATYLNTYRPYRPLEY